MPLRDSGFIKHLPVLSSLIVLLAGHPLAAETRPVPASRPNVVLILADDIGYECFGVDGGQSYKTPVIDRLAATGVRFEQCHVQPLCTPTRTQLMTGRYNIRNYLNFGTLVRSETTFGQLAQKAGYATGICGKWQLGEEKDSPQHFGFDEACLWHHTRRAPRYANPGLDFNGQPKDYSHGEYGPDIVNDWALDFITRHKSQPFFLYYPMMLTHDPFQPTPNSPDWDPKAMGEKVNRNVKHFADMTVYLDKLVGTIEAKLTELGIRDNTLVLFLGDNGTHSTVTSRFQGGNYRGGKGSTTERGTHVALIANWPAVIKSGRVLPDLISSTDLLPTLCGVFGAPVPANVDGVSFLPQLRGERGTPREWLYMWYSPRQQHNMTVSECAFDHDYKLYRDGSFFDLKADPFENKPLPAAGRGEAATAGAHRLQKVLDQFAQARPIELDRAFEQSAKDKSTPD